MQCRREKRMPVIHTRVEQAYVRGLDDHEARAGKQVIYPLSLLDGCELAQEKFSGGLDEPTSAMRSSSSIACSKAILAP